MSNHNLQCIAATFSSYERAHAAVRILRQSGYANFNVTLVQGPVEPDVPRITSLAANGGRFSDGMADRLAMMGVPREYGDGYSGSIMGDQVLAVIQGQEQIPAIMSELSGYATSIRRFSCD